MNALPVIARELREESRRSVNYWLRVLAAGALILVFATAMLDAEIDLAQLGAALFAVLKRTLLLGFWVLVPLMTADCISREKREGTLGLLFLTPLTVNDVIAGKAAMHALRAVTLFLAAMPILGLPFVFGGVSSAAFWFALVQLATAVLLGIAAGIFASIKGGSAIQVMVMAEVYALGLAVVSGLWTTVLEGIVLSAKKGSFWLLPVEMLFSIGLFVHLLKHASEKLRQTWQQESAAPERPRWVEEFSSSEFWQVIFRWDETRTLDRNPIAWLQEYSWTARLTKWGWCLALLFAEFVVLSASVGGSMGNTQIYLTGALALGVAFSAVGSFRRERQTGLLELLLVSPLSVRQLINGRIWGICCHYFPAIAVLMVGWIGDRMLNPRSYQAGAGLLISPDPLTFAVVMVVGLWLALGQLNFFVAWLLTWSIAFLVPGLVVVLVERFIPLPAGRIIQAAVQLVLAASALLLLYRNVRLRKFLRAQT
jgi:ABC-type Na+ efflux pump permease subunit